MNKQIIILIAFVAVVLAMPASAETIEIRGEVVNLAGAQARMRTTSVHSGMIWTMIWQQKR